MLFCLTDYYFLVMASFKFTKLGEIGEVTHTYNHRFIRVENTEFEVVREFIGYMTLFCCTYRKY